MMTKSFSLSSCVTTEEGGGGDDECNFESLCFLSRKSSESLLDNIERMSYRIQPYINIVKLHKDIGILTSLTVLLFVNNATGKRY
jgi:hypothetical protein